MRLKDFKNGAQQIVKLNRSPKHELQLMQEVQEQCSYLKEGQSVFLSVEVAEPERLLHQVLLALNSELNQDSPIQAFYAQEEEHGHLGIGICRDFSCAQGAPFLETMRQFEKWRTELLEDEFAFFSVPFDLEDTRSAPEWEAFLGLHAFVPAWHFAFCKKGIFIQRHSDLPLLWTKTPALRKRGHLVDSFCAPNHLQWLQKIKCILESISENKLQKTVAARSLRLHFSEEISLATCLSAPREKHGFFYFLRREEAFFTGQSPELLCDVQGDEAQTEALAGTAPRLAEKKGDGETQRMLLASGKDRHEQNLVVRFLTERLQKYGEVSLDKLQIRELTTLFHLESRIHLHLQHFPKEGVLGLLHPTPAVCGLPQQASLLFLRENEDFHRGLYAGAQGVCTAETLQACVALRSMLCRRNQVHLHVGAGIVAGSNADAEWRELDQKTKATFDLLLQAVA